MPKVILMSQMPLPFSKIESWPTLYKNYLSDEHLIDYIVCARVSNPFTNVTYSFVRNDVSIKIEKRIKRNPYIGYFKALKNILEPKQKYIIQIVDNFGIVKPLVHFLTRLGIRDTIYLQFFYHGFPPFYGNFEGRWFFDNIDEMILLTHDSYIVHKNYYTILPTRFSVLHNGIDTKKFYKVSSVEKAVLKEQFGVKNKTVFVWCSQDRPKKGLHIILGAWKKIHRQYPNTVLWVVGCEPKKSIEGVEYLGRIPNEELPKYYQTGDCYLFSTLCHEGFGLSLIEALHCGCYSIASSIGGVPEVMEYGKFGKLIERPHCESDWVAAILEFLDSPIAFETVSKELYNSEKWRIGMNKVILEAKSRL